MGVKSAARTRIYDICAEVLRED